jgi:prepilin-type N-terminal cleavage/methylation domain-containing protein
MPAHRRIHRGFTLVELLVAIGIIVILIGLLLPAIKHIRLAAYGASSSAQIAAISTAIQQYYNDFNAYPGPLPQNQIDDACLGITSNGPSVLNQGGTPVPLNLVSPAPSLAGSFNAYKISGAQNLVLGLLGGLTITRTVNGSGQTDISTFQYDPSCIFSVTGPAPGTMTPIPSPKGPSSLSIGIAKQYSPYITVTASDISAPAIAAGGTPGTPTASFADAAGRTPSDTIIPVFIDKYPDAMPILYMRANRGATGVVSLGGLIGYSGTSLNPDPATSQSVTSWQYDLREIYSYTNSDGTAATSNIGLNTNMSAKINRHGLQVVWNPASTTTYQITSSAPIDAWAYLRNPDLGPAVGSPPTDIGIPRQKDSYILISAGPDRVYGSTDDITNFGTVAP